MNLENMITLSIFYLNVTNFDELNIIFCFTL